MHDHRRYERATVPWPVAREKMQTSTLSDMQARTKNRATRLARPVGTDVPRRDGPPTVISVGQTHATAARRLFSYHAGAVLIAPLGGRSRLP